VKQTKTLSLIVATTIAINTYSPCAASLFDIFRKTPKKPVSLAKKIADLCIYGSYATASAAGSIGTLTFTASLLRKAYLRFTQKDEISMVKRQNPELKEILEKNKDLIVRVYGNDKKFIATVLGIAAACAGITVATGYGTKLMLENLVKTLRK